MSLIDRWLTSVLPSAFDALDASKGKWLLVLSTMVGVLGTIGSWCVHLKYPWFLYDLLDTHILGVIAIAVVLTPPFLASYCIGRLLLPELNGNVEVTGQPLSGYLFSEKEYGKWRMSVVAGMIAGLDLLAMWFTSQPG